MDNKEIIARLEHMLEKLNRLEANVAHLKPIFVASEKHPEKVIKIEVNTNTDVITRGIASIETALAAIHQREAETLDECKRDDR